MNVWCVESLPSWSALVRNRGAVSRGRRHGIMADQWGIKIERSWAVREASQGEVPSPLWRCASKASATAVHRCEETRCQIKKALYSRDFVCILSEDFWPAEGRMEVISQCAAPPQGARGAWKGLSLHGWSWCSLCEGDDGERRKRWSDGGNGEMLGTRKIVQTKLWLQCSCDGTPPSDSPSRPVVKWCFKTRLTKTQTSSI